MSKRTVEKLVYDLATNIIKDMNLELVDVKYTKEGKNWFLRVFIDKPDGIDIEECRLVSRQLSKILDELDPIPHSYTLEVSSPGLERPLIKESDYTTYIGKLVNIRTYQAISGIKEFEGKLNGLECGVVNLSVNGNEVKIPYDQIAKAHLVVEF